MINFHGRFAWYELITTEAEAAKEFYSKVMGWGVLDASLPVKACSGTQQDQTQIVHGLHVDHPASSGPELFGRNAENIVHEGSVRIIPSRLLA